MKYAGAMCEAVPSGLHSEGEPQTIVFLYDLGTNHADVAHAALHTPI